MATNKYFIYYRKSSLTQRQSLAVKKQGEFLFDFAKANGLVVAGFYYDIGSKNTEFRKMLKAMRSNKANCILTSDLSRVIRSNEDTTNLLNAINVGVVEEIRSPGVAFGYSLKPSAVVSALSESLKHEKQHMSDIIKRGIAAKKLRDMAKTPQN